MTDPLKSVAFGDQGVFGGKPCRDGSGRVSVRLATQTKRKNFAGRPEWSMRGIPLRHLKSIYRVQSSIVIWLLLIFEPSPFGTANAYW